MSKKFENGVKLYHSHRYELALNELREAETEMAPTPELDYYIGLTLTQLGKYDEALFSLEKVVTSHFSFLHIMQARMVLGYIYAITGRFRLAEFEFNKVNEFGLQSSQALAALGYVFYRQKKIDESMEALKKAMELDPNNSNAINSLGFIYAEENRNVMEAVSLCRKAVEAGPKNPAYLDSLGWALFKQGNHLEAKATLRKALDLAPGNKEIAAHMRQVLDALKQSSSP
jgi:tetratricopeptide (TPR) repeat protein